LAGKPILTFVEGPQVAETMNRLALICGLALALAGLAGSATAQTSAGMSVTSKASAQSVGPGPVKPAAEPKALAGMLAAQNVVRSRLNLSQLSWSAELEARAVETVEAASSRTCSKSTAQRAGEAVGAAIFWAAPLRMFASGDTAQVIAPTYLVSEWQTGAADYDGETRQCRKGGACKSYARLADPEVRTVGCARVVCDSQAQVWACHYGP
jgi:hypothetical protein